MFKSFAGYDDPHWHSHFEGGKAPQPPDRLAPAGEGAKILEVGFNAGHSVCLMMCLAAGGTGTSGGCGDKTSTSTIPFPYPKRTVGLREPPILRVLGSFLSLRLMVGSMFIGGMVGLWADKQWRPYAAATAKAGESNVQSGRLWPVWTSLHQALCGGAAYGGWLRNPASVERVFFRIIYPMVI